MYAVLSTNNTFKKESSNGIRFMKEFTKEDLYLDSQSFCIL
jgi:hypothetical protein